MEDPGLLSGIVLFILLCALGMGLVGMGSNRRESANERSLFLMSMTVRFAAALAIYQFGLVRYLGDEDSQGWYVGRALAENWESTGARILEAPLLFAESYQYHHKGYYYLLGVYFFLTSAASRMAAAALNCFFGSLIVCLGRKTARLLFPEQIAASVGLWLCFFPSLIIWSAQTVKEPVVIFLESATIYSCVSLQQQRPSLKHIGIIILSVLLLIPFRFYAAYLAAAAVFLSFAIRTLGAGQTFSLKPIILSCAVSAVAASAALTLLVREKDREVMQQYDLEGIERYRDAISSTTGSGVNVGYDLRSVEGFSGSILIGGLNLLFAPFPWQLARGSLRMLLVTPEVVLWWWLLLTGIVPGIRYVLRRRFRDVLPLLLMALGLGLLYSLTFSNIGLVYRQRAQLLPWLLIFGVVGRDLRLLRRRRQPQPGMDFPPSLVARASPREA